MLDPNNVPTPRRHHDDIPEVSETVIKSFAAHLPGFEALFAALKADNPQLARYILTRTEQLASGDIRSKERLARVAVELYGLVTAQHEADQLQALFDAPSQPDATPLTVEIHRHIDTGTDAHSTTEA